MNHGNCRNSSFPKLPEIARIGIFTEHQLEHTQLTVVQFKEVILSFEILFLFGLKFIEVNE